MSFVGVERELAGDGVGVDRPGRVAGADAEVGEAVQCGRVAGDRVVDRLAQLAQVAFSPASPNSGPVFGWSAVSRSATVFSVSFARIESTIVL